MEIKGNKQIIKAWTFYDWANSVYALVISTAIFPIYFGALSSTKDPLTGEVTNDIIMAFGRNFKNTELMSYAMATSYLIVSFITPILSGIADYSGKKKFFLQLFCYLGAISCISLFFFDINHIELSLISVVMASVGFWGSIVFYNSFLPEIAEPSEHDKISAKGFSMGYIGSSILLIICLIIVMGVGSEYTKYTFILTGVWWMGFAQYTFKYLPSNVYNKKPTGNTLFKGFNELYRVWKELKKTTRLSRYLFAFFIYSMGVQTVLIMATYFAEKEIKWTNGEETSGLIISILLIQFIAIPGAQLHYKCAQKFGNLNTLVGSVFLWLLLCFGAWFITTPLHFYITAAYVGFIMGGVQALSRSTYSKFLPETTEHASYFSFYDVCEKLGLVIGTFAFGFMEGVTGSMRNSILLIGVFFFFGVILLALVPKNEKHHPILD
jgi:MFS transporter, UMF1 family